jgi:AraC family carnitine catabolism transcriptional activator
MATDTAPGTALLRSPIGFLLIPQFAVMALASAIEPLRIANRYLRDPYRWQLLSLDGAAVVDDNGIPIQPHGSMRDAGPLGTLIVCADIRPERFYSRDLRRWLHQLDRQGAALGSLDNGCVLLARAGLLEGCRVTMHWEIVEAFRERFPGIAVAQTLFELDRRRLTCAGGTAALDMMLHAIGTDHGATLASRVAEHCLHERIRSGDAAQRMALPVRTRIHHPRLARAVQALEQTLDRPIPADELAATVDLSVRQLLRLFSQHLGEGPAQHHRRLRLEHARTLLRNTSISVTEAALAVGFESVAHFCRAYGVQYGRPPGRDRRAEGPARPLLRDRSA